MLKLTGIWLDIYLAMSALAQLQKNRNGFYAILFFAD
jgi:hypothetical protein